jgi:hypothetical protein
MRRGPARPPVVAAAVYFALVFALGFVLGTVRTLLVQYLPGASRLLGVLVELPIMLGASWFLCRFVVRRFGVAHAVAARAVMGGLAFVLLQLAELLLGALLFGRTPAQHLLLFSEASYALGLAGQVGFGLMPLVRLRWREPR